MNTRHRIIRCSSLITRRSARALTLVEILVVIGIIGILVAVTGLAGMSVREKGKREYTRGVMDALMAAVDEFRAATGRWPEPANDPTKTAFVSCGCTCQIPYEPGEGTNSPRTAPDFHLGTDVCARFSYLRAGAMVLQSIEDRTLSSIEALWVELNFPFVKSAGGSYEVDSDASDKIRVILGKVPETLKSNKHGGDLFVHKLDPSPPSPPVAEAMEIRDAWGSALRYRYYTYRNNNRPFLWSAGRDGKFAKDPNRTEGDPDGADDVFSDRRD